MAEELKATEIDVLVVEDDSAAISKITTEIEKFNTESVAANYPFQLTPNVWDRAFDTEAVSKWVVDTSKKNTPKHPMVLLLDNAVAPGDEERLAEVEYQTYALERIKRLPDEKCTGAVRLLRHLKDNTKWSFPVLVWTNHDHSGWHDYMMTELRAENCIKKVYDQIALLGHLVVGAFKRWYQRFAFQQGCQKLVGTSPAIERLRQQLRTVLESVTGNVFLVGEAGVGKSLVAEILGNALSAGRHFRRTNVTGLSESLLESELFGHLKDSFTGAKQEKRGLFEVSNGGALVLEEIGDLPLYTQAKVLVAVDPKVGGFIHKVGSQEDIKVHVRVISSTNRNIPEMVEHKQFREDLWQRLGYPHVIRVPTLQERYEDFADIARALLKDALAAEGRWWVELDERAMKALKEEFLDSGRQARLLGACIEKALAIAGRLHSRTITEECMQEAIDDLRDRSVQVPKTLQSALHIDIKAGRIDLWEMYEQRRNEVDTWLEHAWRSIVAAFDGDKKKAKEFCAPTSDKKQKLYDRLERHK